MPYESYVPTHLAVDSQFRDKTTYWSDYCSRTARLYRLAARSGPKDRRTPLHLGPHTEAATSSCCRREETARFGKLVPSHRGDTSDHRSSSSMLWMTTDGPGPTPANNPPIPLDKDSLADHLDIHVTSNSSRVFRDFQAVRTFLDDHDAVIGQGIPVPVRTIAIADQVRPSSAGRRPSSGVKEHPDADAAARAARARPSTAASRLSSDSKQRAELSDAVAETEAHGPKSITADIGASKRDREYGYSLEGKKVYSQEQRVSREVRTPETLPGLREWMGTANEYEKGVVYDFVTALTTNMRDLDLEKDPIGVEAAGERGHDGCTVEAVQADASAQGAAAPTSASQQGPSGLRASSPGSAALPPTPPESGSPNNTAYRNALTHRPPRTGSATSVGSRPPALLPHRRARSALVTNKKTHVVADAYSDHVDPTAFEVNRQHFRHNPDSCGVCHDRLIKATTQKASRIVQKAGAKVIWPVDDYVQQRSVFQPLERFHRGYYIVHPDWVSDYKKPINTMTL